MLPMLLLPVGIAFLAAIILVPVVRAISIRYGLVDKPDAERKLHEKPIALAGGVAVFTATLIGFCGVIWTDRVFNPEPAFAVISMRWLILLAGAAGIMLVGLVDDAWSLRGRQKLLCQCVIAMILVGSGNLLENVSIFGFEIALGPLAIPISVLWLLIAINALNLLDGADGMATTIGCIVCASLALLAFQKQGFSLSVVVAMSLCGALAGFLVYNKPPASIFLGDAGSMTVGLMVGVLSMWCSLKESTIISAAPIAILVLPLVDSSAAIIRRWMTGRSLYATDRGHLHHLLHARFGGRGMLVLVATLCIFSSAMAILSVKFDQDWMAPVGALLVLGWLVATRSFGYAEFRLLFGKSRHVVNSFLKTSDQCVGKTEDGAYNIQGNGVWDVVWEPLVEFAKKNELSSVKIDVNMAWLHEGYHASWKSVRLPEKAFQSVVRIPLFTLRRGESEPVPIGRVEVIAGADERMFERLGDFLSHAGELQTQVQCLIDQLDPRSRNADPGEGSAAASIRRPVPSRTAERSADANVDVSATA